MQEPNTDTTNNANNEEQFTEELTSAPEEPKAERIDTRELKDDAAKREKQQPLITRIAKAIKREKKAYTELIINSEPLEKRVALLKDGVLEKFEVERTGEAREVGAIFKGRIQNLGPEGRFRRHRRREECLPPLLGHPPCRQRQLGRNRPRQQV